jgi:hypothetical protein
MKRCWLGIAALVLVAAISANGQIYVDNTAIESFNLDFNGGGARAEAMGGAFMAISDDVTGGSWNPAGIYQIEGPALSITFGSLLPRGNTETMTLGIFDRSKDHGGSFNNVTSLNFVAPLRIKGHQFVGSFNYVRNYDEYQLTDVTAVDQVLRQARADNGSIYIDTLNQYLNANTVLEGGLNSANFAFSTRVYKSLSMGVSANVYAGRTVRDRVNTLSEPDSPTGYSLQRVLLEVASTSIDSNKFSGVNFTLGLKSNGEKLDAALLVRTPFALNVKRGQSIYILTTQNGVVEPDASDTIYVDDLLDKYEMPLMIGGGIAYQASEKLLVALEAEYRGYGSLTFKHRDSLQIDPSGNNFEYFTEYDPAWENSIGFRLGAEYMMRPSIGNIPIRCGFAYQPLPAPSIDTEGSSSLAKTYRFAVGTGIHWDQIRFDLAYSYSIADQDIYGVVQGYTAEMQNRDHHLSFSFTGVF